MAAIQGEHKGEYAPVPDEGKVCEHEERVGLHPFQPVVQAEVHLAQHIVQVPTTDLARLKQKHWLEWLELEL